MRETLQQQFERLLAEEDKIRQSHLDEYFDKNPTPKALFRLDFIGNIKQIEIIGFGVGYYINGRSLKAPFIDRAKKPTGEQVKLFANYVDSLNTAERQLLIQYRDLGIGAYRLSEITPEKSLAFNEIDLQAESARRCELYAPREGCEPCAYCRKQVPVNELIRRKIYGRGRHNGKACVTEQYLKFCSAKCAGNEQMSREG